MKIRVIPPLRAPFNWYSTKEGHFIVKELLENMRKKGALEGVEYDVDEGYPTDTRVLERDDEFFLDRNVGVLKRIRAVCEMGKYDGILCNSSIDPAFYAGQEVANYFKIPIVFAMHAAVHLASLIGERFSIIDLTDPMAQIDRRKVEGYGLGHKLVSVRAIGINDTVTAKLIHDYKKEDRINVPECKKVIDAIVAHGINAVEKERADTLLIACPVIQPYEDEVRQGLDEAGYDEIQLICEVAAGMEMIKALVNMKIRQAPRAFPSDQLKAKPEFR